MTKDQLNEVINYLIAHSVCLDESDNKLESLIMDLQEMWINVSG